MILACFRMRYYQVLGWLFSSSTRRFTISIFLVTSLLPSIPSNYDNWFKHETSMKDIYHPMLWFSQSIRYFSRDPFQGHLLMNYYLLSLKWKIPSWCNFFVLKHQVHRTFLWRRWWIVHLCLIRHGNVFGWLSNNWPGRGIYWIYAWTHTFSIYHWRHIFNDIIHGIVVDTCVLIGLSMIYFPFRYIKVIVYLNDSLLWWFYAPSI